MAPQKMSCKNDAKYMYTGKEMSPMGLGYCAEGEMVGKKMMGRDNKEWIVGTKNGVKIWQRAPDAPLVRDEPILKKQEIEPASDNETDTDSDADDDEVKPDDEEVKTPEIPKPVVEEVKPVPDAPKKRGRPAKVKPADAKEVKPADGEAKPKRKYTRKPKNVDGDEAKPDDKEVKSAVDEAKPKRKYTRKPKNTEEGEEKKERKPRAKTEYNMYISEKLKELREKHKELKTTEYFKMAIAEWKVYKENKNTVEVA
ncbi:MAG: hypothetical protein ACO236_06825 [Candidatus Nanopelagicaceae bacterium]